MKIGCFWNFLYYLSDDVCLILNFGFSINLLVGLDDMGY